MKIDQKLINDCLKIAGQYFKETSHAPSHRLIGKTVNSCYSGTRITTKLYATKGPRKSTFPNFKLFVEETPIKNIIALGFAGDLINKRDFINYGFSNKRGNVDFADGDLGKLDSKKFAHDIYGTLFVIKDGEYLNGKDELAMTALLNSYAHSLTEPTIVHCKAGTGRTGHIIMTFLFFEFLFHMERTGFLDELQDEVALLQHFKQILATIRKLAPRFVHHGHQFVNSIHNAFYLYQKVKTLPLDHPMQQLLTTKSPHLSEITEYKFLSLEAQIKKGEQEQKISPVSHLQKTILTATEKEKRESAIQACTCEIASDPLSIDAYFRRADLYYQHQNNRLAIADYSTVIRLAVKQPKVYLLALGNRAFLYNLIKKPNLAIDDYNAVIEGYSKLHISTQSNKEKTQYTAKIADMYEKIANIHLLKEDYQLAEAHYNDALRWDPNILFNPNCSQINEEKRQNIATQYPQLYLHLQMAFSLQGLQSTPPHPISTVSEEKEKITAGGTPLYKQSSSIKTSHEIMPTSPGPLKNQIAVLTTGPQFFPAAQSSPKEAYANTKDTALQNSSP